MDTSQIDIAVRHGAELTPDQRKGLRDELQMLCARTPPIGGRGLAGSDVRVYFTHDPKLEHRFQLKLIVPDELYQQPGIGSSLRTALGDLHPGWHFGVEIEPRDQLNSITVEVYHEREFSGGDKARIAAAVHQSFISRFGAISVKFVQEADHNFWVNAKLPGWMHNDPDIGEKIHYTHRALVTNLRGTNVRFTANIGAR